MVPPGSQMEWPCRPYRTDEQDMASLGPVVLDNEKNSIAAQASEDAFVFSWTGNYLRQLPK